MFCPQMCSIVGPRKHGTPIQEGRQTLSARWHRVLAYGDAYVYADAIYSELFEGIKQKVNWNETQIAMINMT